MHIHVKPIAAPHTSASQPVKPVKAKATQDGADVNALLALSGDRRNGPGSQSRHRPTPQENGEEAGDAARMQPTTSLAVLLTEMDLDRTS